MGEPCYCAASDCPRCNPNWRQAQREEAHELAHGRGRTDCEVCIMQRYERMCRHAGKPFPRDLLRKAWEAV